MALKGYKRKLFKGIKGPPFWPFKGQHPAFASQLSRWSDLSSQGSGGQVKGGRHYLYPWREQAQRKRNLNCYKGFLSFERAPARGRDMQEMFGHADAKVRVRTITCARGRVSRAHQ